ncbi:glycosyltransferase [Flocculibacter collagenilyticus]|uniref:glycosyltransferase n=1 Tax=Flocculibacter collagenilyticus TaxID=2744479 RepID=UPI0018F688B4|nr:glycosyltransferase [Flocculibacter collagenilyticus]
MNNTVNWLANPHSPHVRHWVDICQKIEDINIVIWHIHHKKQPCHFTANNVQMKCIVPSWLKFLPESFQYILLGLQLRVTKNQNLIHAHNTSGYGIAALLSGFRFGVTTYGSEIFSAQNKSYLYKLILQRVLKSASFITSTSSTMTSSLNNIFHIPNKQISTFSLGVASTFHFSHIERAKVRNALKLDSHDKLFVINRRVTPLYRTEQVLRCFMKAFKGESRFKLLVLAGDADPDYLALLRNKYQNNEITFKCEFLSQEELSSILSASDFFISTPKSDQLSSAILEGITCESVPILSNLASYAPVKKASFLVDNNNFEPSLTTTFLKLYKLSPEEYSETLSNCRELQVQFNIAHAANSYRHILLNYA